MKRSAFTHSKTEAPDPAHTATVFTRESRTSNNCIINAQFSLWLFQIAPFVFQTPSFNIPPNVFWFPRASLKWGKPR